MKPQESYEEELFAADIAAAVARRIGAAYAVPGQPVKQVRKRQVVTPLRRDAGISVLLVMDGAPRQVEITVQQTAGEAERDATFEGVFLSPTGTSPEKISGTAHRTETGEVEITTLRGVPEIEPPQDG